MKVMKKILIVSILMLSMVSFAATSWDSEAALKRVNNVGTKILKNNPPRI